MLINIGDYISEEEKREFAREAYKDMCRDEFVNQTSRERIFGNAAYSVVSSMVDESIDGSIIEKIKDKAMVVINDLSEYTVFHKGHRSSEDSRGYQILTSEIEKKRGLISERLTEVINSLDKDVLKELLQDEAMNLLDAKLFGKDE